MVNYKPLKPKESESEEFEFYAAYITYSTPIEASLAILAVDNTYIDNNHCIRATFGNTKYCEFYLIKKKCTVKNCLYVHSNNNQEVIVEKDNFRKLSYKDLRLRAAKIANIFDKEVKKRILSSETIANSKLPSINTIYSKPPIVWYESSVKGNKELIIDLFYKDRKKHFYNMNDNSVGTKNKVKDVKPQRNFFCSEDLQEFDKNISTTKTGLEEQLLSNKTKQDCNISNVSNITINTTKMPQGSHKNNEKLLSSQTSLITANKDKEKNLIRELNSKTYSISILERNLSQISREDLDLLEIETKVDTETNENAENILKTKTNSLDFNSSVENLNINDLSILLINDIDLSDKESNIRKRNERDKDNNKELNNGDFDNRYPTKVHRRQVSCILPSVHSGIDVKDISEIPDLIIRILHNRQKNLFLNNKNKFSKICGVLREQILNFSAEGIGATEEESQWAKHILETSKEL